MYNDSDEDESDEDESDDEDEMVVATESNADAMENMMGTVTR